MKHKTAKTIDWQQQGGIIEIPDGWFVTSANFDVEEPYIVISSGQMSSDEERTIKVPKSLAYYLSSHHCGSNYMHEIIEENTRHEIKNAIKEALGL
jgi:hypothetical protein